MHVYVTVCARSNLPIIDKISERNTQPIVALAYTKKIISIGTIHKLHMAPLDAPRLEFATSFTH